MQIYLTSITPDPEKTIATEAAICYDSDINDPEKLQRRIKHLIKLKHLTTLRFAYATFHIDGISRVCSHQLVRVAHAGQLQRSQRYVDESGIEVIIPPSYDELPECIQQQVAWHIQNSRDIYQMLLAKGIKKEDARFMLLEGSATKISMTGNFQMWREWLSKRLDKAAQWEIRGVAETVARQLNDHAPNVFGEFVQRPA